jgi:hypothetical protein
MGKKGAKATRKFAKSGELKRTIDARRNHQKVKKQIQTRKALRGGPLLRPNDKEEKERYNGDSSRRGKGKPRSDAIDFLEEDEEGDVGPEDEEFMDDEEVTVNARFLSSILTTFQDEEGDDGGDISSLDDLEGLQGVWNQFVFFHLLILIHSQTTRRPISSNFRHSQKRTLNSTNIWRPMIKNCSTFRQLSH